MVTPEEELDIDNDFNKTIDSFNDLQNTNATLIEKLGKRSAILSKYREKLYRGDVSKNDIDIIFSMPSWNENDIKADLILETFNFLKDEAIALKLREEISKKIEIDKIPREFPFYNEFAKTVEIQHLQILYELFIHYLSIDIIYFEDNVKAEKETYSEKEPTENEVRIIYNNEGYYTTIGSPSEKKFVKGAPLFLDEAQTIPIGYNMLLPQPPIKIKNVIVEVYGGGVGFSPEDWGNIQYAMLKDGTAFVTLNMSDLLKLKTHQRNLPEDLFWEIQASIHKFYTTMLMQPETLDPQLAQLELKGKPMYLMGSSFGGLMTMRHAELYPETFKAYISMVGAVSTEIHKKIMGKFRPWLNPADEMEISKISEPVLLLHTRDDSNVNVKVTLDFYKKASDLMKKDLFRVCIMERGGPMPSEPRYKGHSFPSEKKGFEHVVDTLATFISQGPSALPAVSEWRVSKEDILANRFHRFQEQVARFSGQALALYKKHHHQHKEVDEIWDQFYKPLLWGPVFAEEISKSSISISNEIDRLKKMLTDEMIVKTLLSQADIFSQFIQESTEFPKNLDMSSLLKHPSMIRKFKEYLFSFQSGTVSQAQEMLILSALYKANPELLNDLYAASDKKKIDFIEKIEKEKFKKIIETERNKIKKVWKQAVKETTKNSASSDAIVQKWQDTVNKTVIKEKQRKFKEKQTQIDDIISKILDDAKSEKSVDFTSYYVELLHKSKGSHDDERIINQAFDWLLKELVKLDNNIVFLNCALALLSKEVLSHDPTKIQDTADMVTQLLIEHNYPCDDIKQLIDDQCKLLQEATATPKLAPLAPKK